jgi:hypothetical protein
LERERSEGFSRRVDWRDFLIYLSMGEGGDFAMHHFVRRV